MVFRRKTNLEAVAKILGGNRTNSGLVGIQEASSTFLVEFVVRRHLQWYMFVASLGHLSTQSGGLLRLGWRCGGNGCHEMRLSLCMRSLEIRIYSGFLRRWVWVVCSCCISLYENSQEMGMRMSLLWKFWLVVVLGLSVCRQLVEILVLYSSSVEILQWHFLLDEVGNCMCNIFLPLVEIGCGCGAATFSMQRVSEMSKGVGCTTLVLLFSVVLSSVSQDGECTFGMFSTCGCIPEFGGKGLQVFQNGRFPSTSFEDVYESVEELRGRWNGSTFQKRL